jgi:hypothetical protein
MSIHFAYPNVLPKKGAFIGCGRYTVFAPDDAPPARYNEVQDAPNTPNKNSLKRAVQLLASESYESTYSLFHRQDQSDQKYQGDSLDLAWFLVHILRAHTLRYKIKTDIWCTGVIQVDGSGPHLLDVNPDGFTLKLEAFLDPANTDLLFIVPLANLDPPARSRCRENNVPILRLNDINKNSLDAKQKKTTLAVAADELSLLLELFFVLPSSPATTKKKTGWFLLFSLLALSGGVAGTLYLSRETPEQKNLALPAPLLENPLPAPLPIEASHEISENRKPSAPKYNPADIIMRVEQGKFSSIPSFLNDTSVDDNSEVQKLREEMGRKLLVQGELEYRLADGKEGKISISTDITPPVLNHRDYYRLRFQMNSPPDALYLYLFQVDSRGNLTPLFPSSQFGTNNPVRPWQWPISIPDQDDKWIFLDQLSDSTRQQSLEILYVLTTPWPAKDIESLSRKLLNKPGNEDEIKAQLLASLSLRQQLNIPSITCIRWSFFHGQ